MAKCDRAGEQAVPPFPRDHPGQLTHVTVPLGTSKVCQLWRTPEAASWAIGHGPGDSHGRGALRALHRRPVGSHSIKQLEWETVSAISL